MGCDRSNFKAPSGLAFFQAKGTRLSLGNDSGRTNRPQQTLAKAMKAEAQKGSRGEMAPSSPPTAGPSMNPTPKAAPMMPKAAARFSGGVTSEIYAPAVLKLAAVMPEMTLPSRSHHRLGASAMRMKSSPKPAQEMRITLRRPKWSESEPCTGEKMNCISAQAVDRKSTR